MTPDIQCPVCHGHGKMMGMFPKYAPHVPAAQRRRVIELTCGFCNGSGSVTAQDVARREQGKKLRSARLARGMGLREAAVKLGVSPVHFSRAEQGFEVTAPTLDELARKVREG